MKFNTSGELRYLTFDIFPKEVVHGIFTRHGGVSPNPWNSLNMGGTVGDERERVIQNRYHSFSALDRERDSMFDVWQVHSADVVMANSAHDKLNHSQELKADVMITDNPEVSLFMRFADCTPVLLYDPHKKIVSIVHAGWVGTVKKAAKEAVTMMGAVYGTKPEHILAAIGPSIGPDHYEVGENVIEQVHYSFGVDAPQLLQDQSGHIHFDLWGANRLTLEQAGVRNIEVAGICTACHSEDWFSHREEKGKTGRFGALIALAQ